MVACASTLNRGVRHPLHGGRNSCLALTSEQRRLASGSERGHSFHRVAACRGSLGIPCERVSSLAICDAAFLVGRTMGQAIAAAMTAHLVLSERVNRRVLREATAMVLHGINKCAYVYTAGSTQHILKWRI
jgi:hypothetical protein